MNMPAPEPTSTPDATSLVGQVVSGRYRIQALLGEGGMGAVYLAEHTLMRKRVALKLLHAEMSSDEEVLARFRREAEAAAHVEHPNVAAATDFGQTEDGSFFLVLEYVEGTSLRDILRKGALGVERSLHVARQIAFALERAHTAGIVHRDLKPENVMLVAKSDDPDFVKVLDFGIAKVEPQSQRDAAQPLTRLGTILGTPEYMAPEQALGETVGPGADLYAVGVMLYEMLTGRHPFDADDRMAVLSMHIVAPVPKMSDHNPAIDVPPAIEQVVRRLLEKDAQQRPQGARALVEEIDVAAAQSGIELRASASSRVLRESTPDLFRTPPAADEARQSRAWTANDALAKTDYGLPAVTPAITNAATSPSKTSLLAQFAAFVEPLKYLPRRVVLAIAAAFPVFVLLLVVVLILAKRSSTSGAQTGDTPVVDTVVDKSARPTRAPADRLRAAQTVAALEALAEEYPEDPAVVRQLALSLAGAGRTTDMLRAVRTLAKLDKDAVDDKLIDAVVAAAQRTDTADDAFALLEGPLGARGIEALFELSTTKTAPATIQRRAAKSLTRADVRANASAATGVLLDLKAAKGCAERHDLLDRVKDSGDTRLLPTLKAMKSSRGCGFAGMRDCWPCMRKDDALDDAIKAVEARSSK